MAQVSKINGIPVVNTSVSAFTYDGTNQFTIGSTDGVNFNASIDVLSATTFSGVTYYGDGSNLTGIVGGSLTGATNIGNATEIFSGVNGDNLEFRTLTGATPYKITTAVSGDTVVLDINEPNMILWPLVVNGNQLISGGATLLSGLTFNVSALEYIIGTTIYTASASTVTLLSGGTNFDRIDVIYADISGNTGFVQGTESATPSKPSLDGATQVEITFVTVPAGSTTPDVDITKVYDEDTGTGGGEWDYSANTAVRISGDSTSDAFSGTKSIELINAVSGDEFTMNNPTPYDTSSDNTISFYVKNITDWSGVKEFIEISFRDSSDVINGNTVRFDDGNFGFDATNVADWQVVSVGLGDFGMTSNIVSKVRFQLNKDGGGASDLDLYIDLIRFQAGAPTTSPQNIWLSFVGDDNNVAVATSSTDQLRLSGGTNIGTRVDGKNAIFDLDDNISLTSVSATTISATTFYGDGSNLTGTGENNTASNLTTTGFFAQKNGVDLEFKGLTSTGSTVFITTDGTTVNVENAAGGGESNTGSNVGTGNPVFKQKTGVDLEFRTLVAGTNVTITSGATELTISSTGGGGGSSRITGTTTTTNATATEIDKIDTLTDNTTSIVKVYVKAYQSGGTNWGVWTRTLTVTKTSGTVTIQEVNADVDKTSVGLNANDVTFTVNGGDVDIDVSGIAATTIIWNSAYEIII
jgi:hypothetical protein